MTYDYRQFYSRKLPHIHSPGSTLFITFRLKNSIPRAVVERWKRESRLLEDECRRIKDAMLIEHRKLEFHRRWFAKFEQMLHEEKGPLWLKVPAIARIVAEALHHLDGKSYDLHSYCIMANHAHTLFTPFLNQLSLTEVRDPLLRYESDAPTLGAIMQSLKGYSAREANKLLGRRGQFWDVESYDHEVRTGAEFRRIVSYILNNPVKAGLVKHWRDWRWSWVESGEMSTRMVE
jgi:REP element-mobilizing transposase RayT